MPSMRTHKKSRLGCGQCKRRRVKCDEAAPCCGPCTKKGIECEYKDLEGVPDKIRSIMQQEPQSCLSQAAVLPVQSMGSENFDGNESAAFSSKDMLLMHQYTLSTSRTIGILDDDTYRAIWQARVPVLACQYQHLLHAILSTTAAHLSDISTSRHHYSRAIELFSTIGTIESSDQQDSVFCYCVLMMLTTFALDCVRSDDLSACVAGLTGGFKMIRTAIGLLATFQSDLRAREMGQLLRHMDDPTHTSSMPDETQVSLARLDYIIGTQRERTSAEIRAVLREGLASLRLFFARVPVRPTSWVNILQWPKALPHEFLGLVENMDPAALAMVAHWCVPLHHAPHKWYAAGWPKSMILAIAECLEDGIWRESMTWPVAGIMK